MICYLLYQVDLSLAVNSPLKCNFTDVPSSFSIDASDAEVIRLLWLEVWDIV